MQFLDDDIDHLFRRAAEEYPLNTKSADWDKVLKGLQSEEPPKKDNRWKTFLFLLALAVSWIINTYVGYVPPSVGYAPSSPGGQQPLIPNENLLVEKNKNIEPKDLPAIDPSSIRSGSFPVNRTKEGNIQLHKSKRRDADPTTQPSTSFSTTDPGVNETVDLSYQQPSEKIRRSFLLPVRPFNQVVLNNPLIGTAAYASKMTFKDPEKHKAKQAGYLYTGLVGGVDVSNVKMQKVSKTGYTAGILLGYSINNKWSIESGAYFDQKAYYSSGEYFKPNGNPPYSQLKSIEGVCRMIELPLTLKFNFNSRSDGWYATTGISSYLMKKEDYNYTVEVPGGPSYTGYREYKNSTKNWFSVLHLSVGYSKNAGHIGTIRIEPYLKAPLKGLGFGRLPITSTGVTVGLTRRIF